MQSTYETTYTQRASWLDRPILGGITIRTEVLIFTLLVILAFASRLYILGERVMSHDENSHVYYSWKLFRGQGFAHDPLMHGPLQFHLLAASYFMFGDNDFTGRLPQALFSIATVAFMWNYRRFLGRAGALAAGVMMLISPYMLYYGRYTRNEAFVALFGVITLWAILRYLESGQRRYVYWLTAAMVLHFTSKETSFIYMAQALMFLALYLIFRLTNQPWRHQDQRNIFLIALIIGLLFIAGAGAATLLDQDPTALNAGQTAAPVEPGATDAPTAGSGISPLTMALGGMALLAFAGAAFFAVQGYGLENLRAERAFDLLMVMGTLVLPQLAAFPIRMAGWDIPTNAGEVIAMNSTSILRMATFLVPMLLLSIVIGLWWNPREWLINAGIWYALFTIFYTTIFTNGAGFFTGMLGSLGYWLEQQGVNRGNQPSYYYWLIQVPVYEYLPAIGSILALFLGFFGKRKAIPADPEASLQPSLASEVDMDPDLSEAEAAALTAAQDQTAEKQATQPVAQGGWIDPPVLSLLGFWVVTSFIAYTLAGEKMPWLTVHITLPMILLGGWAFGWLIDAVDWSAFRQRRGLLLVVVLPVVLISLFAVLGSLLGPTPPFQGKELNQLRATSTFLLSFVSLIAAGVGVAVLMRGWLVSQLAAVTGLIAIAFLGLLTARAAFQSSYINYDNANELLVYAHMAGGVKEAMDQVEEISLRTTDGLALQVAYDSETSYPMLWYLRNYPNAQFFGAEPTRSLRDKPVIIVGDANYGKIEPVVGQAYHKFEYIRIWWPNQDYFNLNRQRIADALSNPQVRNGLFQIWLNRDYSAYFQATNQNITLPTWSPAQRFRIYIRKDVVSSMWNYGLAPSAEEAIVADPYEGKGVNLQADLIVGGLGQQPGFFQRPRDLALAPDGSLYIADTENNRIQHITADGTPVKAWGTAGDVSANTGNPGTFNAPWGIAVGPDGSVYVADTWNHRVQKFTADGEFVTMWGYFGQRERPEAFWGPRDVAVDKEGRVYVTDTGNKRIVVFDGDGNFIKEFGEVGLGLGQFDEPVGVAVDENLNVYVADTWNQRIQVFKEDDQGVFQPVKEWEVVGWYGQSLDNKPYIALAPNGHVFAVDPEGYRVLEFTGQGEFVRYWGDYGVTNNTFGIVGGVAPGEDGVVWVSDAGNSRIMRFKLP